MRIGFINLVLGFLLLLSINVLAQDNYEKTCSEECNIFTKSCMTYVECMIFPRKSGHNEELVVA
jgi:hypothetical protein